MTKFNKTLLAMTTLLAASGANAKLINSLWVAFMWILKFT